MAALRGVEPGAINFCSVMLEAELESERYEQPTFPFVIEAAK
jgi:hypothetical protein